MDRDQKVELFQAVSIDEALERGTNVGSSRGNWYECSYCND